MHFIFLIHVYMFLAVAEMSIRAGCHGTRSCAIVTVTLCVLVTIAAGRFIPMATSSSTQTNADDAACDQYLLSSTEEWPSMQYLLCKFPNASAQDLVDALYGQSADDNNSSTLAEEYSMSSRNKRKLSVDMDTDLAAEHFRQVQAHRRKLQNDLGVLEHFLHVGRK